jgi:hypothetical protein
MSFTNTIKVPVHVYSADYYTVNILLCGNLSEIAFGSKKEVRRLTLSALSVEFRVSSSFSRGKTSTFLRNKKQATAKSHRMEVSG